MGWAVGEFEGRDIGYGVPAICDHPECDERIDRGLGYICGNGEPYGGEDGCGLFFCMEHGGGTLCERCELLHDALRSNPDDANPDWPGPFAPKPDVPEWIAHKLTDGSWQQWRDAHPEAASALQAERVATLITQCRRIAAILDEQLPDTALNAHAYRIGGVNPYYSRTTTGLYLQFYYGYPSKLWTPGGRWDFVGSTVTPGGVNKDDLVEPFMIRLTTSLHQPITQDRWGCYGPVYAIHQIEGEDVETPGAVTEFTRDGYLDMKQAWAALAEWETADAR